MNYHKLIFFILTAGALTGCSSLVEYTPTVNTISNAETQGTVKRITDSRFISDSILTDWLYLTAIRESQTNDGYLKIQFFMKNMTQKTLQILYRVNWYNSQGIETESPDDELWKEKTIIGGDDLMLQAIAPEKDCKDFKLKIKAVR